nr:MAG TPA: hypothetical protein [Caudoviricetes sp.]
MVLAARRLRFSLLHFRRIRRSADGYNAGLTESTREETPLT